MTKVYTLDQIKHIINPAETIKAVEDGFRLMGEGKVVIAPLSSLSIPEIDGMIKIKYGYIKGAPYYVIKTGSFFPKNKEKGLGTIQASMQIYNKTTGELEAILLDEAYLTNIRTAATGAFVAKYFAPQIVTKIGIVGTGVQARLQLEYLRNILNCNDVLVYGRDKANLEAYKYDMEEQEFNIEITEKIEDIPEKCNVIVTTTSATEPYLKAEWVKPGTHITTVGADTKRKQELDPHILEKADQVVADSMNQCLEIGEISHAIDDGIITANKIQELGDVVLNNTGRRNDNEITVVTLTGVAVQDIQIAIYVYQQLSQ